MDLLKNKSVIFFPLLDFILSGRTAIETMNEETL